MAPAPDSSSPRSAIVLLSGGLDSATTLALARAEGFVCRAITFDYGQRHRVELEAARRIGQSQWGGVVEHIITKIDLRAFGGSALTDEIAVPKDRLLAEAPPRDANGLPSVSVGDGDGIPITYVPARNTIFLSFALAFAEVRGARDIFIGVNAIDYSGYPDCRPAFIAAFERTANVATRMGVEAASRRVGSSAVGQASMPAGASEAGGACIRIHAPLIHMTKAEIIRKGVALGVDFSLTTSCYDPDPGTGRPCGHCDSCLLRAAGFREAGMQDPALGEA